MLSLSVIRHQTEWVKERLAVKKFAKLHYVDTILEKDKERREYQLRRDQEAQQLNQASKQIGLLLSKGDTQQADKMKAEVSSAKTLLQELDRKIDALASEIEELLLEIPNTPTDEVPKGNSPEDNVVVRSTDIAGFENHSDLYPQAHWELGAVYDLLDFEAGSRISGSGFLFYKNRGAKLQRKLIEYFLDYNTARGYTEYQVPLLVNKNAAFGTTQLPDKEGQMYHVTVDDLYLIPTGEVPLTNLYQNEILEQDKLPIKITGHSACFRREAGSYGKDVKGLNRLHQFDKVEIVQMCEEEQSGKALLDMVAHVEELLQSLALPYRILRLCGGDMGFSSAITYDFEVYSPAQKRWLEVSSVSNFLTFQSNRLNLRYRNADKKVALVHTLNGSSLALPRIVAAILECYQTKEGIKTPDVLKPYIGSDFIAQASK